MRLAEEREDETSKKAYREIKSFTGTAKLEGPGPDKESGKRKVKKQEISREIISERRD